MEYTYIYIYIHVYSMWLYCICICIVSVYETKAGWEIISNHKITVTAYTTTHHIIPRGLLGTPQWRYWGNYCNSDNLRTPGSWHWTHLYLYGIPLPSNTCMVSPCFPHWSKSPVQPCCDQQILGLKCHVHMDKNAGCVVDLAQTWSCCCPPRMDDFIHKNANRTWCDA